MVAEVPQNAKISLGKLLNELLDSPFSSGTETLQKTPGQRQAETKFWGWPYIPSFCF